jgi:hypothetical protein
MNLKDARKTLHQHGMVLTEENSEYCVTYADSGSGDTAYYTNDLTDAVSTGIFMSRSRNGRQRRVANWPTKQSFA